MRVLFISHSGVSPIVYSQGIPQMKELSKKGFNFTFLSFQHKSVKKIDWLEKELKENKIDWRVLNYWPWPFFPVCLLDIIRGVFYIGWLVKKRKIEVIQTRSYIPAIMAWFIKKLFGIKFIFDMRGLIPDEQAYSGNWPKNSLKYKLAKYVEKKLILSADSIVVVNESFKDYVQNSILYKTKKNIAVIPNCVDVNKFVFNPKQRKNLRLKFRLSDKLVLVYSGSFAEWHLIDEMINFFIVLKETSNRAHFLILSYEKDKIKTILNNNLIEADYTIIDVPPQEMPNYLSIADLAISFIQPTFTKKIACSPIKFAEYLSTGLPVIINGQISGTDEMVKKNNLGVVIDEFNKENYQTGVKNVLKILEDKNTNIRCRKFIENNLSLKQSINKYESIYQSFKK
jgi:glycosyltransferase involved in cell wall biosynthesis